MKRLLVVADHSLVIHSIRLALRQTAGFQVAGFVDGRGPIAGLLERHQPEVVLLDDMRLRSDALDRLREIATVLPDAQTVLLTTEMDDEWVAQAFEAGARTVISKSVHPVALGTLLREVAHGNIVHRAAPPVQEHADQECPLTQRELEILRLVAEGLTNKEIAVRLHVEQQTIKNHMHNILERLRLNRRQQAVQYAWEAGMLHKG